MNKLYILLIAFAMFLPAIPGDVSAQTVGVYMDTAGTDCNLVLPPGVITDLHVVIDTIERTNK